MSQSVIINSVIAGLVVWYVTKNLNQNPGPAVIAPTATPTRKSDREDEIKDRVADAATGQLVGLIGSLGFERDSETYA